MSQNSWLIVIGALWSLTTTVYLALRLDPGLAVATPILAIVLFLSAFVLFASDLTGSKAMRWVGCLTHLSAPLAWLYLFSGAHQTSVTWLLVALTSCIGWGTSDLGLYLEAHQPDLGYENEAFLEFVEMQRRQATRAMAQLSNFESESFRPIAAYDSGGFSLPQL